MTQQEEEKKQYQPGISTTLPRYGINKPNLDR